MTEGAPWDSEADVVVVGSGAAGLSAAVAAATKGASVTVLERAAHLGGTTAKSGGTVWIPNNGLMRSMGWDDPRSEALQYMVRLAFPHRYDPVDATLGIESERYEMIATFYDRADEALEALSSVGALQSVLDAETPSYHADLVEEAAPYGRSLKPADKPADQTHRTGGEVMIDRMAGVARGLGAEVLTDHRVASVVRDNAGQVIGVEVHSRHRTLLFRARKAVVFCSGGFLHDTRLARAYLKGPVFGGCASATSTGDFVRVGLELGARFDNMSQAWWSQVVIESALRNPSTIRDVWIPFGDSMIQVNRYGRRVVNEKMPYNERSQVHFAWEPGTRSYPNLVLLMIYDDAVANDPSDFFRDPVPKPGERVDYVISGDTWEELAGAIDKRLGALSHHTGGYRLDPGFIDNLRATVARFNAYADDGRDLEFRRGESPIQIAWGGRERNRANPTMHRFADQGPYHCVILGAGSLDTNGGPATNTGGQVLDARGAPISGLYGAGNCVASPAGQAYWGAGATIGLAVTFGYIAGTNAAREPDKHSEAD